MLFAAWEYDYENSGVIAVFSTREAADAYVKEREDRDARHGANGSYCVEEYELDAAESVQCEAECRLCEVHRNPPKPPVWAHIVMTYQSRP